MLWVYLNLFVYLVECLLAVFPPLEDKLSLFTAFFTLKSSGINWPREVLEIHF